MDQASMKEAQPRHKFELTGVEWKKINSIEEVEPGDHISYWGSWLAPYWHHAIVDSVKRERNLITIILWSLISPTQIIMTNLQLAGGSGPQVHKAEYTAGCFNNDEVLHRARSRVGETEYNVITNFARAFPEWCKTGRGRLTHNDLASDLRLRAADLED